MSGRNPYSKETFERASERIKKIKRKMGVESEQGANSNTSQNVRISKSAPYSKETFERASERIKSKKVLSGNNELSGSRSKNIQYTLIPSLANEVKKVQNTSGEGSKLKSLDTPLFPMQSFNTSGGAGASFGGFGIGASAGSKGQATAGVSENAISRASAGSENRTTGSNDSLLSRIIKRSNATSEALAPVMKPIAENYRKNEINNISAARQYRANRSGLQQELDEINNKEKQAENELKSLAESGASRAKVIDRQEQLEKELKADFERRNEIEALLLDKSAIEFADVKYRDDFDEVVKKSYDKFYDGYFNSFPKDNESTLRYLMMTDEDAANRYYQAVLAEGVSEAADKTPVLKPVVTALGSVEKMGKDFAQVVMPGMRFSKGALESAKESVRENTGGVGGVLLDVESAAVEMLPMIAAAVASGGSGTPAVIAKGIPLVVTGVQSAGSEARSMLNEGYSAREAWAKGTMTGVTEAALNNVLSGVSAVPGKVTGSASQKAAKALKQAGEKLIKNPKALNALSAGGRLVTNMAGEGVEEWISQGLEPIYQNVATGEKNPVNFFSDEGAYSFLIGALTAGVIEAPSTISNTFRQNSIINAQNRMVKDESVTYNAIANAMESGDQNVIDRAQALKNKMDTGGRVTISDINDLVKEYSSVYERTANEQRSSILNNLAESIGSSRAEAISDILTESRNYFENRDGYNADRFERAMTILATDRDAANAFYDMTGLDINDRYDSDVRAAAYEFELNLGSGAASAIYKSNHQDREFVDSMERVMREKGVGDSVIKNARAGILSILSGGEVTQSQARAISMSENAMKAFNTIIGVDYSVHTPAEQLVEAARQTKNDAMRYKLKGVSGQTARYMQDVSGKTGTDISIDNTVNSMRGVYEPATDTILFSPSTSENGIVKTLALHELASVLKSDSDVWQGLIDYVAESKYGGKEGFDKAVSRKIKAYKALGVKIDRAKAISSIMEGYIQYELPSIRQAEVLVQKDPILAGRIYNELSEILSNTSVAASDADAAIAELGLVLEQYGQALNTSGDLREQIELSGIDVADKFDSYPPQKQREILDYIKSTDETIVNMVKANREGELKSQVNHDISEVSPRQAEDIKKILGIDVTGYKNNIAANEIRHIERRHGINGENDKSMANADDVARVGWILENYDNVEKIKAKDGSDKTTKAYRDSQGNLAKLLLFYKKVNGTYYSALTAAENKSGLLHVISAYISKNKDEVIKKADMDIKNQTENSKRYRWQTPPSLTSETFVARIPSNNYNIPYTDGNVNSEFESSDNVRGADTRAVDESGRGESTATNEDIKNQTVSKSYKLPKPPRFTSETSHAIPSDNQNIPYADGNVNGEFESSDNVRGADTRAVDESGRGESTATNEDIKNKTENSKRYRWQTPPSTTSETVLARIPSNNQNIPYTDGNVNSEFESSDNVRGADTRAVDESGRGDANSSVKNSDSEQPDSDLNNGSFGQSNAGVGGDTASDSNGSKTPTIDEISKAFNSRKRLEREYLREVRRAKLNEQDTNLVESLIKGAATLEQAQQWASDFEGVKRVYTARKKLADAAKVIKDIRNQKRAEYSEAADKLLKNGDFTNTKDAATEFRYSFNNMQRNTESAFTDFKQANDINDYLFNRVKTSNARRIKKVNEYIARINRLNIKQKKIKGDMHTEAFATQFYGEAKDYIERLKEKPSLERLGGLTLKEWQDNLDLLWQNNPGLYAKKEQIDSNLIEIRKIYNELFDMLNEAQVRNGSVPIEYRRNYFPHFLFEDTDLSGKSRDVATLLITPTEDNVIKEALKSIPRKVKSKFTNSKLPTEISGITAGFTPYSRFFANERARRSNFTDYDVIEGFKRYLGPASEKIYFMDDIFRLRTFAQRIRYWASDEGMQERYDRIVSDPDLTEYEKQMQLDNWFEEGRNERSRKLSNYVSSLNQYTNRLAGKTPAMDIQQQRLFSRAVVSLASWWRRRVGADMTVGNFATATTSFIPLAQARGVIGDKYMRRGMAATLYNLKKKDGLFERSDFLINRQGTDLINPTLAQRISNLAGKLFNDIDMFAAESIVRARYLQNLDRGLSEVEALKEADLMAARIMVDRSKGSLPEAFDNKNLFFNTVLQFQIENINQFQHLLHDIPREYRGEAAWKVAASVLRTFVYAWAFNEFFEALYGRRPIFDPIDIVNDFVGDVSGYKLPNSIDMMFDLASGKAPQFEVERKDAGKALSNLGANLLQEVPVINTFLGGGRYPVFAAIPQSTDDIAKSLAYIVPPFGGAQLMKTIEGISAVKNKGVYSKTSKGDKLRYPVHISSALQNVLFGKNASREAREWVESGFESYSTKETQMYTELLDNGESSRAAIEIIDKIRGIENKQQQYAEIDKADIAESSKNALYMQVYDGKPDDKYVDIFDNLVKDGAQRFEAINTINSLKSADTNNQKYSIIKNSQLGSKSKNTLYLSVMGDDPQKVRDYSVAKGAGIPMDTYFEFVTAQSGFSADKDSSGKAINGSKKQKVINYINNLKLTKNQKNILFSITGYSKDNIDGGLPWENDSNVTITDELLRFLKSK